MSGALLNTTVPLPTVPVTNEESRQTDLAWQRFFMALWYRTGGAVGVLGVPGGVNGNVQYNNHGSFGGYTDVQLTTHIQPFTSTLSGAVPAGGVGSTKFLRQDATFQLIDLAADVTGRLPFANFATLAATSLFGNGQTIGATGANIAIGSGITLSPSGTLSATGSGGTVTQVVAGTNLNVGAGPGGTITTTGTLNLVASPTVTSIALGTGPTITQGAGTPSASAPNGSIYLQNDSAVPPRLYQYSGSAWYDPSAGLITNVGTVFVVTLGTLDLKGPGPGLNLGIGGTLGADWHAGTVSAIGSNLTLAAGSLGLQNSPTVSVTSTTLPFIMNGNTAVPAGAFPAGTDLVIVGANGAASRLLMDGYGTGANPAFTGRRALGTLGTLSAVTSNEVLFQLSAFGYGATAYSAAGRSQITMVSAENWSDTAQGTYINFTVTANGGTVTAAAMRVQNSGDLTVGTTADVSGGGKLQVVGSALIDQINVGTVAATPRIISGAGAPAGTQTVSTLYIRSDGSIGAGLYFANAGGTYTAVAGV